MKIAVTSRGQDVASQVDPSFGRAAYFVLVDAETGEATAHDNSQNLNAVQGAGIQAGRNVVELGAEAVLTGNVGPNAFRTLSAADVKIFVGAEGTVGEAIEDFKAGKLQAADQATVEGHGF